MTYRRAPCQLYHSQVTGVNDLQACSLSVVSFTSYRRERLTGMLLVSCIIHKLQACMTYRRAPCQLYNPQVTGVHDLQACSLSVVSFTSYRRERLTGVLLVSCIIHKLQACTTYRHAPCQLYHPQVTGVVILFLCPLKLCKYITFFKKASFAFLAFSNRLSLFSFSLLYI